MSNEPEMAEYDDPAAVFYAEWAEETAKRNMQTLNDSLGRMVVLSTTLFGGCAAAVGYGWANKWLGIGALTAFAGCLAAAASGLIPYSGNVVMWDAAEICAHKKAAMTHKRDWLTGSFASMMLGFVFVILALILK